jgi:histidine triad (HIT) family protein
VQDCIFCRIAAGAINSAKVYEDEHTLAFLDIFPAAKYHTLVIPKAHFVNVLDIPDEVFLQVMATAKKVVDIYSDKLGLKNLQLLHSAGREGQQDVFHLHVHIVPRATGDGQNVKWKAHPEWRAEFDEMLAKLKF